MKLSRGAWVLAAVLVLSITLVILLTPLGFESRPPSHLKIFGYMAIGTVIFGLMLDVASVILLFWRTRLASSLALIGSIILLFPNVVDQTGSFFSLPIPPVINILEYIFTVILLVTLLMAFRVHKENHPSPR